MYICACTHTDRHIYMCAGLHCDTAFLKCAYRNATLHFLPVCWSAFPSHAPKKRTAAFTKNAMPHLGKRNAKEKKRIYFNESAFDEPALAKFVDISTNLCQKKHAPNQTSASPQPSRYHPTHTNKTPLQTHKCAILKANAPMSQVQPMCCTVHVRKVPRVRPLGHLCTVRFPDAFSDVFS